MIAAFPIEEERRLEILDSYEILDSEYDKEYDDLAQLAAHICEAPIALITLVGEDRQWFKSRINCDLQETSRDISFCAHTILGTDLCVVADLRLDERFASNPLVTGERQVRFYAGAPLISPEGLALGTICIVDYKPRILTREQEDALRVLSRMVMNKLDLQRRNREFSEVAETVREQAIIGEALRDSEHRSRLLSDAFSPIHWSMKADLTDFQPSDRWLEFTGMRAEEVERDGWFHTVHPEDRAWSIAEIERAYSLGEAHGAEVRLLHHDGSWRWMYVRAVPLKGAQGEVLRWLGTNVDIHDQHQAEEALRESEERLRLALDVAEVGTWDTCLKTGHVVWDERGREQYGMPEKEASIDEATKRIHPEDLPGVMSAAEAALHSADGMYHCEFRIIWPDGSLRWLSTKGRVHFSSEGSSRQAIRITGVNRDITERRKSKMALQSKTELLTAVSESLGVFLSQGDWNKALARLLRCAIEQTASGYGFIAVLAEDRKELRVLAYEGMTGHPEADPRFTRLAEESFRETGHLVFDRFENLFGSVVLTGEVVITNDAPQDPRGEGLPPGHPPLITYLGVPILCGSEVVGMISLANRAEGYSGTEQSAIEMLVQQAGLLCDSYRQNEREAALKRNHESLEAQLRQSQKMEAVGQLAGGVAHDFNNLLTVITGHAELSLMQFPISGPQRDSLLQIAMAGERAAQLTRQLLTFSRRQIYQPQAVCLNEIILEIVKMLQRMVGEKVTILTELTASPAHVFADASMIEQVLMNLVVNARDAMPDGGSIVIKTGTSLIDGDKCQLKLGAKPGQTVWVSVTDHGCGIAPENLARIFEPFFTTKEVGAGTGIGLATVYGIIQQHGGWIEVESEVGRGTKFTVLLSATTEWVEEIVPSTVPMLNGGHESILLVEDEEFVRMLARTVLEDAGYTVLEAATGAEALEVWEKNRAQIGLLLTDMVMPGHLSGRDIAEAILNTEPNLPVIYCSGYSQELFSTGLELRAGITFLAKPYRPQELTDAIREILDHQTASRGR